MGYATTNVAYQISAEDNERKLAIVKPERKAEQELPDYNFLRTILAASHGLKTWVNLKAR
jgi:hypothetical protein